MKNLSKEDIYIRQFITEVGTENPSAGFNKSILKRLKSNRTAADYRPVISSLAWKIIGGAITAVVISVLLFLPSGENTLILFDQVPAGSIPDLAISLPKISLPVINLSSIVIQSLVVFILLAFLAVITTFKNWQVS
ncbi:hypothetical protein [Algoriphagus antarcticus]|uniref:Uncharacterized protein n=1 Tax=Algoriphagus antarcticus TaxID=238540 RepID=A0A3E0DY60_9BACT|nr:hypothetical protein [Algoriphagus antarcticus]REG91027.1 hypothetical protein C8N25_105137 [Algoriphagus antarcticus]